MSQLDRKPNLSDQEADTINSLAHHLFNVSLTTSTLSNIVESGASSNLARVLVLPPSKPVKDYECPFLDALPLEVRYTIYAAFLPSVSHDVELSQPIEKRESFAQTYKSLILTCKKTRLEVEEWHKTLERQYGFIDTIEYGLLNPDHTVFSLTVKPNLGSCGCVQIDRFLDLECSSNDCGIVLLDRMGCMYEPLSGPDPFRTIRYLQISIGRGDFNNFSIVDGKVYGNTLSLLIASTMKCLQELDVFLNWGLSDQKFQSLLDGGDALGGWHRDNGVAIPVCIFSPQNVNGILVSPEGLTFFRLKTNGFRVTVWHGPGTGEEATSSILENPTPKLISWPSGGGKGEIFEVRNPEAGEVVIWNARSDKDLYAKEIDQFDEDHQDKKIVEGSGQPGSLERVTSFFFFGRLNRCNAGFPRAKGNDRLTTGVRIN